VKKGAYRRHNILTKVLGVKKINKNTGRVFLSWCRCPVA
jgi:hypothetical protein